MRTSASSWTLVPHRAGHVRFGSEADICAATSHVRFTPNSDRKSRHAALVMSALPPKADMCSATVHVCFGPIADMALLLFDHFIRDGDYPWRHLNAEQPHRMKV